MKYLAVGLLSSMLLSGAAMTTSVKAETVEVTAFQLVSLAYDGYFMDQGISGAGAFIDEVERGEVTPVKIVQAGIDDARLMPETINDQAYLHAVELQLSAFAQDTDK